MIINYMKIGGIYLFFYKVTTNNVTSTNRQENRQDIYISN